MPAGPRPNGWPNPAREFLNLERRADRLPAGLEVAVVDLAAVPTRTELIERAAFPRGHVSICI